MSIYIFSFSRQRGNREIQEPAIHRDYNNDKAAINAARRIFRKQTTEDANDELTIDECRKDEWGLPDNRYVGMIAFNVMGNAITFIPARG